VRKLGPWARAHHRWRGEAARKVEAGPRALSGGVACWDCQRGGLSGGGGASEGG
jgi:hypothetical protein